MTAPPENLADRPANPTPDHQPDNAPVHQPDTLPEQPDNPPDDLLSELLRSVRLSGERIVAHTPAAPFCLDFADRGTLHIVEEGEVTLKVDGYPHVEHLRGGDFVLLPRGDAHSITDAGTARRDGTGAGAAEVEADTDTTTTSPHPPRWLCGTFTIGDPQASHLLGSLPAVIILRGSDADGSLDPKALEGLEVARHMIVLEMRFPSQGSAVMVARILDLIFIQIMRTWASGADAEPNWLAGAFDPQIGLALSVIHRDPGHDWTVDELARACNLSRSSFAARFVGRVGKPPATYLNHVRLDAATQLLRDTLLPVTQVAETVGYASEAAFSRAFRSRYGTPPARWRREYRVR